MARSLWVRDRGIVTCGRGLVYGESPPPCACGPVSPPPPPPIPCCTSGAGSRCFWGGTQGQSLAVSGSVNVQWSNTVQCTAPFSGSVTFTDSDSLIIPSSPAPVGNTCAGRSVAVTKNKFVVVGSCSGQQFGRCYRYTYTLVYNSTAGGYAWTLSVRGRFRADATSGNEAICAATPENQFGNSVTASVSGGDCGSASGMSGTNTIVSGPNSSTVSFSNGTALAEMGYECSGALLRPSAVGIIPGVGVVDTGCSGCGKGLGERAF